MVFLQLMAARHLDQLAQYRSAFVPWGGGDHPLTRGGLICEARAAAVKVGEPFERRRALLFELDVTPHLCARLLLVAQLFVKFGQLQLDLGILGIKISNFGQPGARFDGRIWNDRLGAEKLRAGEKSGLDPCGALLSRRRRMRDRCSAARRDDRQKHTRSDHRKREGFSDFQLTVFHLNPQSKLICPQTFHKERHT